jgi:hypothetical protein
VPVSDTARPARRFLSFMPLSEDGNRMTPSHAVKKGTRRRYCISRPLITTAESP